MILQPQAMIDDSGTEPQSPIFILGGFVAAADGWAKFSSDWQAVLDQPPKLDYFKLTEALSLSAKGQFSRQKGWDETKRDNRLIDLAHVIRKYAAIRVHASMNHEEFIRYVQSLAVPQRKLGSDHPYLLLASQLMLAVGVSGDRLGLDGPCDYFFDEQEGFSEDFSEWWPSFKALLNTSGRSDLKKYIGSSAPTYRDEKTFLPLQAADFYAGYLRRHAISNRKLIVPPPVALRQLEMVPTIGFNVGDHLLKKIRSALIVSAAKFMEANPDAPLVHIAKKKSERRKARRRTKRAPQISAGRQSS
jgi:Protein of unknown function (DUF3800)